MAYRAARRSSRNRRSAACAASSIARSYAAAAASGPSRRARGAAGGDEEEEREEAVHLRLVGHELRQEAGEADGLVAEVVAAELVARRGGVALVEHEVEHREHGAEAVGQLGVARDAVRDVGVA